MLPRRLRNSSSELANVFKKGRRVKGRFFLLHYLSGHNVESLQFSVVVSKKVVRGAVERNRIRRVVYSQIEHVLHEEPALLVGCCVFRITQPLAGITTGHIRQDIQDLLLKARSVSVSKRPTL